MSSTMFSQLIENIPQKPPFKFVDRIIDLTQNSIITELDIDSSAPFFQGHFPNYPIMPGVLMLESMFQSSIPLTNQWVSGSDKIGVVVRIDNVKFKKQIVPNCTLKIKVELMEKIVEENLSAFDFSGKIYDNQDKLVASAQFKTTLVDKQ